MRHQKIKLSTLLLLAYCITGLQAQEAIPATGGEATGSGGSASYSVGQVVYQSHTGTSGTVAQGVQQPYEISVVTGIEEVTGINLSVSAYPNPTTDYLTLEVKDFELPTLHFQLYDMNGKLLESKKIEGNQTSIVMSPLMPATYFLKVVQSKHASSQQEIKTFKIIKK